MSTYVQDGTLFLADSSNYDISSQYNSIIINGDSIRLIQQKTPLSTDDGYQGQLCVDGNYLYCHDGTQWKRAQFSTY